MKRFMIMLFLIILAELYTFFALRVFTKNKLILVGFWVLTLCVYGFVIYISATSKYHTVFGLRTAYTIALVMIWFLPKLLLALPLIIEDLDRLVKYILNLFNEPDIPKFSTSRRKFVSQIGVGLAAIPLSALLYGVFKGRYNFRVIKQTLEFDDLPEAFDGYQITHISDIHVGSFGNKEKVKYGIDLINEQNSDTILFTGDMVNGVAEEMNGWIDTFKQLKAKDGIYSILGNHDYGYYAYGAKDTIAANHNKIMNIHKQIGFDLLLNENRVIEKEGQKLHILGVENWGASRHFPKKGSLEEVTKDLEKDDFKILLSHDPSHFDYEECGVSRSKLIDPHPVTNESNIRDFHKKIQLTLSGHTHGMQFGIEIPFLGVKWSPVKYRYPKWAGLYQEKGRYLYVNRGFGVLAFPGRVGMWPEVTVITLKKKK